MNSYEEKQKARAEGARAKADRLRDEFDAKREATRKRFPGTVVAGPSNYPTRQHEKAWAMVDRAGEAWQKAEQAVKSIGNSAAISSDDPDAILKIEQRIAELQEDQKERRSVNTAAEIRRLRKRIETLEKVKALEHKEITWPGYKLVQDPAENRFMFMFDDRPDADLVQTLKRNAFKWSPTRTAWVRKITGNASYGVTNVRRFMQARTTTE